MTVRKSSQSSRARAKPTQDALHALMQDLVRVPGATSRVTERIPLAVEVGSGGASNFYLGATENISDGGIFVSTREPRAVGDHFSLEFMLPGDSAVIRCIVEVAWVRALSDNLPPGEPPGMGLKFIALDASDHRRLSAYVNERLPHTYAPR
jgi:uncharacterized protein (TIGR02266 family)